MSRPRPIVLIHGYSANSTVFGEWEKHLKSHYQNPELIVIHTASYKSLTNEITIKDIAEAFDRVLRSYIEDDQEFDAIVHSTGMLVIRAWLTTYAYAADVNRRSRLKHLIGLAPANFGSPLAHKGRSWLGSIIKGNKILGPDFIEAGNLILDNLELGSRFTWDLAHIDLIGSAQNKPEHKAYYGEDNNTPYVFIFCGNQGYDRLSALANTPGSDGTVRWAGCALNTRKFIVDLTQDPSQKKDKPVEERAKPDEHPEQQIDIPVVLVDGHNHNTIVQNPSKDLVELVLEALDVSDRDSFGRWTAKTKAHMDILKKEKGAQWEEWQQFIIRVVDERLDPVTDWNVQLSMKKDRDGKEVWLYENSDLQVHTYARDKSLRCFHLNLSKLNLESISELCMKLIVSSGTSLVAYYGYGSGKITVEGELQESDGRWDAKLKLDHLLQAEVKFFCPFTTTLIEIRLNREPMPINRAKENTILTFAEKPKKPLLE
ncbi:MULTISPECIES: hypothetical protein [unclassified Microcoleus]|uniref:esterase/lipase family protein n=1 Tax=unclassified Microcoleus TaxID=2642155 RepID=UPI002FCFAB20